MNHSSRHGPKIALLLAIFSGLGIPFLMTDGEKFLSRAQSYVFNTKLMFLHGGADLCVGIGFVAMAGVLAYAAKRSGEDPVFRWLLGTLALTLGTAGLVNLIEFGTITSADPPYWFLGWLKVVTGVAAIVTVILLPPLIPRVAQILKAAKESVEREEELTKAYYELDELYRKATQPAPRKETLSSVIEAARRIHGPERLADIARGVTQHALQLERAKHAAEAANLAKDQFLAVLSHELRTPLTPALAAASSLESNPSIDPQELRESISMIRRNIELEARLVDDLLDLTRIRFARNHPARGGHVPVGPGPRASGRRHSTQCRRTKCPR
jgi:signal transduction histidine kinase